MPGFIAHIGKDKFPFVQSSEPDVILEHMDSPLGYRIERRVAKQHLGDSLFIDTGRYVIVLDGEVSNISELMEKYKAFTWQHCIAKMHESKGDTFFRKLIGSFAGLLYEKHKGIWLAFDCYGDDRHIYYAQTEDGAFISTDKDYLAQTKANEIKSLPEGCYLLKMREQAFVETEIKKK